MLSSGDIRPFASGLKRNCMLRICDRNASCVAIVGGLHCAVPAPRFKSLHPSLYHVFGPLSGIQLNLLPVLNLDLTHLSAWFGELVHIGISTASVFDMICGSGTLRRSDSIRAIIRFASCFVCLCCEMTVLVLFAASCGWQALSPELCPNG